MTVPVTHTTEDVLRELERCIVQELPAYLQAKLNADALRDPDDRLYAGVLPNVTMVNRGRRDDFANDPSTPSVLLDIGAQQFQAFDAAGTIDCITVAIVYVVLSERDVNAVDGTRFLNAISAYANGIAWVAGVMYPSDEYGHRAGAFEARPLSIPYSPAVQSEDQSRWLRAAEVQIEIRHRIKQDKL